MQRVIRHAAPAAALRAARSLMGQSGAGTTVFDRSVKRLQRDRAAQSPRARPAEAYLRDEIAQRLADRLLDIKRQFDVGLDLGSGAGFLARHIDADTVRKLVMCEMSGSLLMRDNVVASDDGPEVERVNQPEDCVAQAFPPESFDCALSNLSLHWVNDLPRALSDIATVLKPDAPFLAAVLGGDTLFELRTSLQLAELERRGGVGVHVSPMLDVRDLHGLLDRAGFRLVTVDVDELCVLFPSVLALMRDLQALGENNAVRGVRAPLTPDTLLAAEAVYRELYGEPAPNGDGRALPATFQVFYVIGWKEAGSQPQPLERGSAAESLSRVLN